MKAKKLQIKQLFYLMILFQLGTIGLNLGTEAGKDAWISLIIGMLEGAILFSVYYLIHKRYNYKTYTCILQAAFGRYIGISITFLSCAYFLYLGSRVTRDLAEILTLHILYETPIWSIIISFLCVTSYAAYKGLLPVANAGRICLHLFAFFILSFIVLVFLSGIFHVENILPSLQYGWRPILQNFLPMMIPYGESIIFLILFPYITEKKQIFVKGIMSILISGSILSITTLLNIGILGDLVTKHFDFPLLLSTSLIRIGTFIQRLEPLGIILLIIGVFFKVFLFQYSAILSIASFFSKKYFYAILCTTFVLMSLLGIFMANQNINHIFIGLKIVPYYLHIPFQIILPITLLILSFFCKNIDWEN
ncbi:MULTISPECIES: GerAB/ArcD/ProY family transporter [Bacillus]|uniref:GerAB/ArcD/ProY family transporter n=1 Tax=Bacillus TaxID=1386 RepID=UPI0002D22A51|nr:MULTISPECIES: endospore germination permease [Bacillus]MEB9337863.1 endospore germination permease [Bacillus cereus]CCW06144.1 Spore germination protein GerKB [Bacillus sp. GeD10]HEF1879948.1 endospore germination permease [Bacillus cereus]